MKTTDKIVSAEEAAALIGSGGTVTVSGVLGWVIPEKVLRALEVRFLTTGEPKGLTLFQPTTACIGPGFSHFDHEGMLKRLIDSHFLAHPELNEMILANKFEAYSLPLGTLHFLLREIAAGRPGLLTQVGLGTFVDPRFGGGKLNNITKEEMVELRRFDGRQWLFYRSFPIDVAIVRGTTADEDGNISMEEEPWRLGVLYQAIAAKNSGGRVIAQVKRLAARGSINPRMVEIPAMLVDAVVLDENQCQNETFPDRYMPGVAGEIRVPPPPPPQLPLDQDKVIVRRAAMELRRGQVLNFGAGLPMYVMLPLLREEGIQEEATVTIEHGSIGGIYSGIATPINPTAILTYQPLFDFYLGGGLDVVFLSFAEVDKKGNVNVSKLGVTLVGAGGALDLAHAARKIVFCGTFTRNGLRAEVEEGRITITHEGESKKFLECVGEITINSHNLRRQGKEVLYVTERAVFRLTNKGLELIEVAPGVDLERNVLEEMDFSPVLSPDLRQMDSRLFRSDLMGLSKDLGIN